MQSNGLSLMLSVAAMILSMQSVGAAREWVDASGLLTIEGDLMGFNQEEVIIKTTEDELMSLKLTDLSDEDQEYIRSEQARVQLSRSIDEEQLWTMASGLKVIGRVVEFVEDEVVIQRRRGNIYVNDRQFSNLPEVYQRMVPKIVSNLESEEIEDEEGLEEWVLTLRGQPQTYELQGVKLELDNGDLYAVPFFLFGLQDREFLRSGFRRWQRAEEDDGRRSQEAMYLEAEARAYQQQMEQQQQQTQQAQARVAQMQLQLLAVAADVTDMWEVELVPRPNVYAPVTSMVVVAQNSAQASTIAANANPQYRVRGIRKLNRSNSGRRYRW